MREHGRAARVCAVKDGFPFCACLGLEDVCEEGLEFGPVGFVVAVAGDVGGRQREAFEERGVELRLDGAAGCAVSCDFFSKIVNGEW